MFVELGELNVLRPVVNYAERSSKPAGYSWGPRIIPDAQFVYVLEGRMELDFGACRYELGARDCALYGADSPHLLTVSSAKEASYYSIHFHWNSAALVPEHPATGIRDCTAAEMVTPPALYRIDVDTRQGVALPVHFHAASLEPLFAPIVQEFREGGSAQDYLLSAYLMTLIAGVIRLQLLERPDPSRSRIARALEAIELEPERNWTVQELAELCGYHPTYFADLFRDLVGQPPKPYLLKARIKKAKQLLLSNEKLADIAEALGYGSVHYFSRSFKETTGLTPSQFRMHGNEWGD